jgi:predicted nuclease with RNAse H fold
MAVNQASTLYLGWDVGGWEGSRDGLAVLRWTQTGRLELASAPTRVRLADLMNERFGAHDLLRAAGLDTPWDRVVIGIDAPLGWPAEFVRLVGSAPQLTSPYLPGPGGEIENRLAYRYTDRVVRRRWGKKPLSAAFDKLGNNATKAITLCQLLHGNCGAVVVPQEEQDGQGVVICEAYPALWKQDARRDGPLLAPAAEALASLPMPSFGTHEADAVLCALTAAWYDNQVRGLRQNLSELWFPEDEFAMADCEADGAELVRQEGWIYFPSTPRGSQV